MRMTHKTKYNNRIEQKEMITAVFTNLNKVWKAHTIFRSYLQAVIKANGEFLEKILSIVLQDTFV